MSVEPTELAAVLAHVDRTTADVSAAALASYGIDATVITDPAVGHAKSPVAASAPAHGVFVRQTELALARDVLRRNTSDLPDEFRDDEVERWSANRRRPGFTSSSRTAVLGALYAAFAAVVVVLLGAAVAAIFH